MRQETRPVDRWLDAPLGDAVLAETLAALAGPDGAVLVTDVTRPAAGGVRYTDAEGTLRELPGAMRDWVRGRLADGANVHRLRAEAAAILGANLNGPDPVAPRPAESDPAEPPEPAAPPAPTRVEAALLALGGLWRDGTLPDETRWAAEDVAGQVVRDNPADSWDRAALPDWAQAVVERGRTRMPRSEPVDPHAALRTGPLRDAVRDITAAAADPARYGAGLVDAVSRLDRRPRRRGDGDGPAGDRPRKLAKEATDAADKAALKAAAEAGHLDRGSPERERKALVDAEQAGERAARHQRIAGRYWVAADQARQAAEAYRVVAADVAALAGTGPDAPDGTLVADVAEAAAAFGRYVAALETAQPLRAALDAGVASGRLPHLSALAARINAMVAETGVTAVLQPDELQRMLRSMWRWAAGEDGVVFPLGLGAVEARIKFRHGDPLEVLDPPTASRSRWSASCPSSRRAAGWSVRRRTAPSGRRARSRSPT